MPLMHYRLLYVGSDLCYLALQPNTNLHRNHGHVLVYHMMCLFTPQFSLGTHPA